MDNLKPNTLSQSIYDLISILKSIDNEKFLGKFSNLVSEVSSALKKDGTIFFAGNGGSASDSDHFATEFVVRFKRERISLPAISLSSNSGMITACANDYDFSKVFSRQCESLLKQNDYVICLSTSGSSQNIIELLNLCKEKNVSSILISGAKTPFFVSEKFQTIVIDSISTARIQEVQKFILHSLCEEIDYIFSDS